MQTINVVQLKQLAQGDEKAQRLHFVIEPVLGEGKARWMLKVSKEDDLTHSWSIASIKQGEVRIWRQINAAIRFIIDQCGDEHSVEVALKASH